MAVPKALAKVQEIVSSNPVVIFSERRDSFSVCVKQLFLLKLGTQYKAIELDDESDAVEIQTALAFWTGQMILPNIFIGGKHIGDCYKTWKLHKKGKLVPLLTAAGVSCPLAQVHTRIPEHEFSQPNQKRIKLN